MEAIESTANGKLDRFRTRFEEMDEMAFETVMNGNTQDNSDATAKYDEE